MRHLRHHMPAVAAVAAAATLAVAAPSIATATADHTSDRLVGKVVNADRLNGYAARDLLRASVSRTDADIDDFDTCTFTTVRDMSVNVPGPGYLMLWGTVGAARDASVNADGLLGAQITVGSEVAVTQVSTRLTNASGGVMDGHVTLSGMVPVKQGTRHVKLQIAECGPGKAYVDSRSVSSLFVPFGHVDGSAKLSDAVGSANRR